MIKRGLFLSLRKYYWLIPAFLFNTHSFSRYTNRLVINASYTSQKISYINDSLVIDKEPKQYKDSILIDSAIKDNRFNSIKNRIINEVTINNKSQNISIAPHKEQIINGFNNYQGNVIRNISFKRLEIFGQSVTDTTEIPTKWYEHLGNELHINTQLYILKNQILISSGDTVDLYSLSENERILRELPFIDDARAIISKVSEDTVDIIFITKDVLPIGGSVRFLDVDYGKASINNTNILGMGHELYYHLTWNYDRNPFYGHKIQYKIKNLGNTFLTLNTSYENQWNMEAFRIYCNRDFFTQDILYAGGVGFEKINSLKNIILPDTIYENEEVDYNYYDLWLGRAITIPWISSRRKRTNVVGTGRITRYEFFKRPDEIQEDLLYNLHERTSYLFSLGISQVGYYKTTEVYGFGRTEDIPFGNELTLTGGVEVNQYFNRPYFGISYAWGNIVNKVGYLYQRIEYGSFFNYGIEQGLLIYSAKYFTNRFNSMGRYSYRLFFDLTYKKGYSRFEDEFMEFTKLDGIRGLSSEELRGNQRLNLSFESICYSPHHIFDFRFVYFLFFDAGIISNTSSILIRNHLYTGFGGGVKIRNENLIFDTVRIRIAYYPLLPEGASPEYIRLTSTRYPQLDNFVVQRPQILQY